MAIALSLSVMAQEPEWLVKFKALNKQLNEQANREDWKSALKTMDNMHKLFFAQPDSLRIRHTGGDDLSNSFYYNLACFNVLDRNNKKAVKAFKDYTDRVIGKQEINLSQILTDSDLDPIRNDKEFKECITRLRKWGDYKQILKDSKQYVRGNVPDGMRFHYANPNDPDLVRLRKHFNLDSIAGAGDEISKIKNLLHWVHEIVPHDGNSSNPAEKNTIAMVELCKRENRGVNCRMMAQMLTECYLAMGFKARFVTCYPLNYVSDCHVITTVYSNTLNKWLWVDPTYDAYVMDEKGTMLSIAEVRERLRKDEFLQINDYANWNHKQKQTKEDYLDRYMAKNLYYIQCNEWYRFNAETQGTGHSRRYITLMPYDKINEKMHDNTIGHYSTRVSDDRWFWQSPYGYDY